MICFKFRINMPNFTDNQFATSILNEFVEHRNDDLLTNCLTRPNVSVKIFRDMKQKELRQQLHGFLSVKDDYLRQVTHFDRYNRDYYNYCVIFSYASYIQD